MTSADGVPETHYARHASASVAYQEVGSGETDIVLMRPFYNHVELQWEEPRFARFLRGLAGVGRLIVFDPRGAGLSDPVATGGYPTTEDWADDTLAVMDAAASAAAVVVAIGPATARAVVFAASHPERVAALILCNGVARWITAPDYPIGVPESTVAGLGESMAAQWGRVPSAATEAADPVLASWECRYRRYACSPGTAGAIVDLGVHADIRHVLPTIQAPTLVLTHDDYVIGIPASTAALSSYLAAHIPDAKLRSLSGRVLMDWRFDDPDAVVDAIRRFVGASGAPVEIDRVLATVLFTDIVDSTRLAASVGDREWRDRLDALDRVVDEEVARFRGRVVKFTGDGHMATFDGPGRAISCATAVRERCAALGLALRAGLHTGEVDPRGDDIGGIAVSIARRVCDAAGAGCVFVSSAVPPLVAGSPVTFHDRGEHELKGVPKPWRLYEVA